MQSIIVAGAARSGKTTLAKRLHNETGGSIFAGDMLVKAFAQVYPELNIKFGIDPVLEASESLLPFLSTWLDLNANNSYRRFILDIYQLTPEQAVKCEMHKKYKIAFFGYPNLSVDEKIQQIRNFPNPNDWAASLPDEKLYSMVSHLIAWSQYLQRECDRFGLEFIDTGHSFDNQLERAYALLTA